MGVSKNTWTITFNLEKMDPSLANYNLTQEEKKELTNWLMTDKDIKSTGDYLVKAAKESTGVKSPTIVIKLNFKGSNIASRTFK